MSDTLDIFSNNPPKNKPNISHNIEFNPEEAKNNPIPKTAPTPDRKKAGRPRKAVKLVRVDTRLAPDDIERVRRLAEKTGHNESAILRELILLGLRNKNA